MQEEPEYEDQVVITGSSKPESHEDNIKQTLTIAYHNLAVEYEHIKDFQSAIEAFREAKKYAETINSPLCDKISKNVADLESKALGDKSLREERSWLRESKRTAL